jgi:CubicO group peptidase (beta-lactamase class C family)
MNRRKLKSGWVVFLLAFAACAAFAQGGPGGQRPKVAGHWEGAIEIPGSPLQILVDLSAHEQGALAGTVSIPAQGARDLPLKSIALTGTEISFTIADIPGEPSFRGTVSANGRGIQGDFMQGGKTFPFRLNQEEDPASKSRVALEGLDDELLEGMKSFDVPGMSVVVVKGKDVVYAKGLGYREVERKLPVTTQTLFAIGSSTKAFTAFALGTLVDEGRLDWDAPVRTYIPWFQLSDVSISERITPRDLVTHRSGLPRHDMVFYNNTAPTRRELVERLRYLEMNADLRERFQYNNLMFLTAGYLTEVLSGRTWEEAVRSQVFVPLGMARSNFSVDDSAKDPDAAQPYERKEEKVIRVPFRPIGNMGPAGSINSCADDMAKWALVQVNGGRLDGKQIISPDLLAEMQRLQMPAGRPPRFQEVIPLGYGMGWFVETYRGRQRVQHGGNIDGFSAMVSLLPAEGIGVVVLANMGGSTLPGLAANAIMDRMLGGEKRDWIGEGAARREKGEEAEKDARAKKGAARVPGTLPAHRLEEYAGDYWNPGYGPLKVSLEGGRLTAAYNGIATPLEHWHYETFNGLRAADFTFEDTKFTFRTDVRGNVAELLVPMEPAVKDIVFAKKPDARFLDPAFLKRFAGTYELAGDKIIVALKGAMLFVTAPGQPPYELVPGLGGEFLLKGVSVVSMRFTMDAQGVAAALEVRQPDGVFTAKRIAD